MEDVKRWAFILDKDQFFRLSLNKILKKYGFEVEEIEDFSQLEKRKKDIEGGMVLADVEIEVLENWSPLIKKWNGRFVLMTPQVSDDLTLRTKKMGIQHILNKPVEPKFLKRVIQKINSPGKTDARSLGKHGGCSRFNEKGGEEG